MIAYILRKGGSIPCQNTSVEARKTAKALKSGKEKQGREDSSSDSDNGSKKKPPKKKLLTKVEKQSQLKVFRGIHVPFTPEQEDVVREQFLWATISANLPFRWVEDPEVMTLFLLFRSTAGNVLPSHQQISGQLLNKANERVTKWLKVVLRDQYAVLAADGWKDESRDSINGVNLSIGGKVRPYLTAQ